MKRAIAVVVIIAAVFLGYRHYSHSYVPLATYKKFAEEILHRHYDAAAAMSEGLTATDLERSGSQEKIGAGPAMFAKMNQIVTMRDVSGWNITSFENKFDSMDTLSSR